MRRLFTATVTLVFLSVLNIQAQLPGGLNKLKGAGDKVKVVLKEDTAERTVEIPADFKKLLKKNKLEESFNKMSFTHRKEWMLWLNDAKKEETRQRRMERAIEKLKVEN